MSQSYSSPTHYDILEIKSTADPEEIRRAYKKKALETHPDKVLRSSNGRICKAEIEARFCQVSLRYSLLD
jgi:curved DNA-binding protein CbpA